tara:strand:+ start:188 stop:454 length:267 start_codon:yes stop_codon:yes gene_type:complete
MKMKYKLGDYLFVKSNKVGDFEGILVEKKKDSFVFQILGESNFNGKVYCKLEEIEFAKALSKKKLFTYMNSEDESVIRQIFSSLNGIK